MTFIWRRFGARFRGIRAMVLISTLIFLVLLFMLVGATLILSGHSSDVGVNLEEKQAALNAAEAGLNYARSRLQERPQWRGDGDGTTTTQVVVRSLDDKFVVEEDNGTVIGYIRSETGMNSQFRFRFNWHDGAGGTDGLDDPSFLIESPYVSFNNLDSHAPDTAKRAVNTGTKWEVTAGSPEVDVAGFTAYIVVEGLAGLGLRDQLADPSNPNPEPAGGNRRAVTEVVEANFRRHVGAASNGVIFAGQNLTGSLSDGGVFSVDSASGEAPVVRSQGNVTINPVSGGSVSYNTSATGEVYVGDTGTFQVNGAAGSPGAIQETTSKNNFFGLDWQEVRKADPSGASVKAGTYVWRNAVPPYLEYYPEEYEPPIDPTGDPYENYPVGKSGGTRIDNASDLLLSGSAGTDAELNVLAFRTEFKGDIHVAPQGGVTGFTIIPDENVTNAAFRRPEVLLTEVSGQSPVITSSGDIYFAGEVRGSGSLTAERDIRLQGSSALEISADQAVAIYAKEDVILEAMPDAVVLGAGSSSSSSGSTGSVPATSTGGPGSGSGTPASGSSISLSSLDYQDQAFAGIIFAGGDFKVDLLTHTAHPGDFFLRGVLSAYGGDPGTQEPGEDGSGHIDMTVPNAYFEFDSQYSNMLIEPLAAAPLIRTSFGVIE